MDTSGNTVLRLVGQGFSLVFWGAPNYEAHLRPDSWMALSGVKKADLNMVYVGESAQSEERLRELHAVLAARDLPAIYFTLPETFERLAPVATELGLTHAGSAPIMTCRPDTVRTQQNRYTCERVENATRLQEVFSLRSAAFSLLAEEFRTASGPDILAARFKDIFVALRDGQLISTAMTTSHGSIAGIWAMATPPQFQGQGAGRAVLEHAMAYHQARGVDLFYLGATVAGKPLYDKVGFTTVVDAPVWVSGVSTQMPVHD